MNPESRSKTNFHLSCTCSFVEVYNHHLFHLLNSLQVSVSYTSNINNFCVPKVKQFARAPKLKFFIGTPHSRSLQILLARIVQLALPLLLLLLLTTSTLRCT
jgi:hypothetical protein